MKVKLTSREPEGQAFYDMHEAGEEAIRYRRKNEVGVVPEETAIAQDVWQATHDAAPDEATEALVELVRAVSGGVLDINGANIAIHKLRATSEGAALIRQTEERDG